MGEKLLESSNRDGLISWCPMAMAHLPIGGTDLVYIIFVSAFLKDKSQGSVRFVRSSAENSRYIRWTDNPDMTCT